MVYRVGSDSARPVRYEGTEKDVILCLTLEGVEVELDGVRDSLVSENVPVEDLQFFALVPDEELTWEKVDGGITITGYFGKTTGEYDCIALPTELDGQPVTAIGEQAFQGNQFLEVYLPKKLEVIGVEAFDNCESLERVIFPDTLKKIQNHAFFDCSFADQEIVIPEGVTWLGQQFLGFCEPKSVYIPASLANSFADGFLATCYGEYIVSPDNEKIKSVNGIIYSKSGKTLFAFPYGTEGTFRVPDGVTLIDEYAFYGSGLSEVELPEGLLEIREGAFRKSKNLTYINFPDSIESIGSGAFVETGLTEVYISESLKGDFEAAFDANVKFVLK